uniref:Ion_trans domain-containing protein n=1 Tax=Macrostomum lignano TaxID=282301 RepID=A0A1I8HL81_9PLAT
SPTWTMTLVKVIFGCYLIITLIVLINLLIAMMSDTYERIRAESDTEWKFGRAKLISNMNKTSSTPTPLILVTQLIFVLRNFRRKHRVQSQSGLEEDDVDASRGDVTHSRGAVNRNAQSSGQENATEHRGGPAKIEDVVDWESHPWRRLRAAAAASEALELTPEPKARQRRRGSVLADGDRESRRGSRIFED